MPAAMFKPLGLCAWLLACAAALACGSARADDYGLWVTSGMHSWHHNASQSHYRDANYGIGIALAMPHDVDVVGGTYIDSDNRRSNYAGVMVQPLHLGGARFGALAVAVSGYTPGHLSDVLMPMASYAYKWAGINLFWYPGKVTALELKARLASF